QRIHWAENPANQEQVVTALDNAKQRRQTQTVNKKPARTPRLDPHSLPYQAAVRQPPTPDHGPALGRQGATTQLPSTPHHPDRGDGGLVLTPIVSAAPVVNEG